MPDALAKRLRFSNWAVLQIFIAIRSSHSEQMINTAGTITAIRIFHLACFVGL